MLSGIYDDVNGARNFINGAWCCRMTMDGV